jgi:hypothetical protein
MPLVSLTAHLGAQAAPIPVDTLRLGQPLPRAADLRSYTARYIEIEEAGGKRRMLDLTTRDVAVSERDNRIVVSQRFENERGALTDTSIVERRTLKPISFVGHREKDVLRVTFVGDSVIGTRTPDGGTAVAVRTASATPAFNQVIDDELVASLPLAPAYAITYASRQPGSARTHIITTRVVRSEELRSPSAEPIDTWVVNQTVDGKDWATFWIAKHSRQQMQALFPQPTGALVRRVRLVVDPPVSASAADSSIARLDTSAVRTLRPGTAIPGVALLRPSASEYAIFREHEGRRQLLVLLSRELRADIDASPETLTLLQRWEAQRGSQGDTSRALLGTLEPLTFRGHQNGVTFNLAFTPRGISGTQTPDDSVARHVDIALDPPVFNEILDDVIVRAQPLALGFVFRFTALDPGETARVITAGVTGSQLVRLADGRTVDTWVITQLGVRNLVVTWWIAKDTREEVQMRITEPGGAKIWRVRLYTP